MKRKALWATGIHLALLIILLVCMHFSNIRTFNADNFANWVVLIWLCAGASAMNKEIANVLAEIICEKS